jgi:hypothetical protein
MHGVPGHWQSSVFAFGCTRPESIEHPHCFVSLCPQREGRALVFAMDTFNGYFHKKEPAAPATMSHVKFRFAPFGV